MKITKPLESEIEGMLFENAALVSNTLICEVGRLLVDEDDIGDRRNDWIKSLDNSIRIFDLMSVTEALVLHDNLLTLPGRVDTEVDRLDFRKRLINEGILKTLDTSKSHVQIASTIIENLSSIERPLKKTGTPKDLGTTIDFKTAIKPLIQDFFLLPNENNQIVRNLLRWYSNKPKINDNYDYFIEDGASLEPLHGNSFDSMGRNLIALIESNDTGSYEYCTSLLRDMYYIFAAEHYCLPHWPQYTRLGFSKRFPNYMDKKLLLQVYKKLADALQTTITEIYDDCAEEVAFVPPFSSIVFERSNDSKGIIDQMIAVRNEYSELREGFRSLEHERLNTTSIKERKKIRLKQRQFLEHIAKRFENPGKVRLKPILRYISGFAGIAKSPTDPTKYNADLLSQPIESIVNWWRRRPISKLFDLTDKIDELENYDRLLQKHFSKKLHGYEFGRWGLDRGLSRWNS